MEKSRHPWLEQRPVGAHPGGAHGRQRHAVVAVDAGDDLCLVRLATQLPVGARHLDAALGRLAAAAREEKVVDRRVRQRREMLGKLDRRLVRAAGVARHVGECCALGARRLCQLASPMTGQHVPHTGEPVDALVPVRVRQQGALALDPDAGRLLGSSVVQRVNQVRGVARDQLGIGHG